MNLPNSVKFLRQRVPDAGKFLYLLRASLFVVLSIIVIFTLGIFLLWLFEPSLPPQEVRISNLTESGVAISWTTEKPTLGFVYYSENPGKLFPAILAFRRADVAGDLHGSVSTVHYVELRNLSPETRYYYLIATGLHTYKVEADGNSFPELTTLASLETTPRLPQPAYGQILQNDGFNPAYPVVVTVSREEALPLSAMTDTEGSWTVDLGGFRTKEGEYAQFGEGPIYVLNAEGGELGSASGILSSLEAQPAEEVVLE